MKKEKLKAVREEKGYSITELADLLKMQNYSYQRRENGQTKISHDEWEKIALFLKVPFDIIFEPYCTIKTKAIPQIPEKKSSKAAIEIPTVVMENQQEYIAMLKYVSEKYKEKNTALKLDLKAVKVDNKAKDKTIKDLNQKITAFENNYNRIQRPKPSPQLRAMAM
jgi:transcriptional regulator with XRE-family HTH domain